MKHWTGSIFVLIFCVLVFQCKPEPKTQPTLNGFTTLVDSAGYSWHGLLVNGLKHGDWVKRDSLGQIKETLRYEMGEIAPENNPITTHPALPFDTTSQQTISFPNIVKESTLKKNNPTPKSFDKPEALVHHNLKVNDLQYTDSVGNVLNGPVTLKHLEYVQTTPEGKTTYYGYYYSTGKFENGYQTGKWKYLHLDNSVAQEGSFKEGKKIGTWNYFYKSGKLKRVENFKNDQFHGEYKMYDEKGNLTQKGNWQNGKRIGKWTYYRTNGNLKKISHYQAGKKNGWQISFDLQEQPTEICHFVNSKADTCREFQNGMYLQTVVYQNNRAQKFWKENNYHLPDSIDIYE